MRGGEDGDQECVAGISYDAAHLLLAAEAKALGTETVKLSRAGRRILAEPVLSRLDAPRFDMAAMDGFAVHAADIAAGCRDFRIVGSSYPAQPFAGTLDLGQAVCITTGAPIPQGTDTVVMREYAQTNGDRLSIRVPPGARAHVRIRASDFPAGTTILPAGRLLDARALVVAAAADVDRVTVWQRPRVAVLASGDELVEPGQALASPHGLPDSLSEALQLLCHQWGAKPAGSARTGDDPAGIAAAAARLLGDCDVLVMVGGASRGGRDFAKAGLEALGLRMTFANVAIKPGKPAWYGRIGAQHVLGLPGNPTAAMSVARLFLVPLLMGLGGRRYDAGLDWRDVPLTVPAAANGDREAFLCGERDDDGVRILERQSASAQALLARADVLVRRPAGSAALSVGDLVPALRF